MKITVFQALTLLAQKYRQNTRLLSMITSVYLSGITSEKKHKLLSFLLKDELLDNYDIRVSRQHINNDPVRRYFESHLAHKTLAASLDQLDLVLLTYYYDAICNEIKTYDLWEKYQTLLQPPAKGDTCFNIRMENTEGIRILKKSSSYESLSPTQIEDKEESTAILNRRKEKMLQLANISYASWFLSCKRGPRLPLDIYHETKGHYSDVERGRTGRFGQTVRSQTLGIMRSYMPLPKDDALLSNEPARYIRPADQATYISGAKQTERAFLSLVTPFCNSISGTLLSQLKVMAEIMNKELFVYSQNENQLKLYFKSYIAYMILHSGGHSLDEYVRVFWLPEVQDTFSGEPGFSMLTLDGLFRIENNLAFDAALDETIVYNQAILNRKHVAEELELCFSRKQASIKGDECFVDGLGLKGACSMLTNKATPIYPVNPQFFRSLEPTPPASTAMGRIKRPVPRDDSHEKTTMPPSACSK